MEDGSWCWRLRPVNKGAARSWQHMRGQRRASCCRTLARQPAAASGINLDDASASTASVGFSGAAQSAKERITASPEVNAPSPAWGSPASRSAGTE